MNIKLHIHHIFETKFLFSLYFLSELFVYSERSTRYDLMDTRSMLVVVGGEFVVSQCEIPLLWVQHHCLFR